ncbi:MAG: T9SS type A sorting domain-containing protein, partial [Bacteroidota bacterium]
TAVGSKAGFANTTGYDNSFFGFSAGSSNVNGTRNAFFGKSAGKANISGGGNCFFGQGAGADNFDGDSNSFFGLSAGVNNNTGDANCFFGAFCGAENESGRFNAFFGTSAGRTNTTGNQNAFYGPASGLSNTIGSENAFFGADAGYSNTNGFWNVFSGYEAGYSNQNGGGNSFFGRRAGYANVSGNNLEAFGNNAGASLTNTPISNSFAIGSNSFFMNSHEGMLGNLATQEIGGSVNWGTLSDIRYKKRIRADVKGLDFILQLQPITYQLSVSQLDKKLRTKDGATTQRQASKADDVDQDFAESQKIYQRHLAEKEQIRYTGFSAQAVEKAAQKVDFQFSGVVQPRHDKDHYRLRYAEFVVPLVKAVQEQQTIIEQQNEKIESLTQELQTLKNLVQTIVNQSTKTADQQIIISAATLGQNTPNPFNGSTQIPYTIPTNSQQATLYVYGLNGQLIQKIPIRQFGKGQVELQTTGLVTGIYTYSLEVDGMLVATKKMNLIK